jgi:hypothetical protein
VFYKPPDNKKISEKTRTLLKGQDIQNYLVINKDYIVSSKIPATSPKTKTTPPMLITVTSTEAFDYLLSLL